MAAGDEHRQGDPPQRGLDPRRGNLDGDAKEQCKKNSEATYKKTMADVDAAHDKAKADYKAPK